MNMARDRYSLCGTFCLCACFFFVNVVFTIASDNERYYYSIEPHHRLEHSLHIELLKDPELHNNQKRDVDSADIASSTPMPFNLWKKVTLLKLANKTSTKLPENFTIKPKIINNLGVNGTGQRENITVTKQESNSAHNTSTSVNTPVKITPLGDLDNPPSVSPDVLTPGDVGVGDNLDKDDLAGSNITLVKTDTHIFYNSTTYKDPEIGKSIWIDMKTAREVKVSELLSNSHRRAATIKLSFDFPFYGYYLKSVTIATGGFLYTGNYGHPWLAATQYIAPLMGNFDTSLSNNSIVKFIDNGTAFTVEWERVLLKDTPEKGEFTFQATLHMSGDIVFVYKNIPFLIENINDDEHPVKVGLSDAYILDRTVFYVRRKTIFEYHRVTFSKYDVRNWTSIYLKALPTCLDLHNCSSCVLSTLNLNCTWCPMLNQCSTGQDRNRQYWVDKGCDQRNVTDKARCASTETINHSLNYDGPDTEFEDDFLGEMPPQSQLGASGYIAIVFLVAMVTAFGFWTVYAYRNPHTASGQMLIRYRPTQWRWRRGEARYTAATIHM